MMFDWTSDVSVTGDAEIDRVLPQRPRLIEPLVAVQCGVNRTMLLGGLFGPVLPLRVGGLNTLDVLQQMNGSRTMASLLNDAPRQAEVRRRLVMQLAHLGMLEEGQRQREGARTRDDKAVSFFSRVFDQTRVFRSGAEAAAHASQPVRVGGDVEVVERFSRLASSAGLQATRAPIESAEVVVVSRYDTAKMVCSLTQPMERLLVAFRGQRVHFGPFVRESSKTLPYYLRETRALPWRFDSVLGPLQLAWCMHAFMLYRGRGMVFRLVNNHFEWSWNEGRPELALRPIARLHDGTRGGDLSVGAIERLRRHSAQSVPPRHFTGSKTHELHYAPQNMAAAGEYPRPSEGGESCLSPLMPVYRHALPLIRRVFGMEQRGGRVRRFTPTGGNLGSPECLLVHCDSRAKMSWLLHYVPLSDTLEHVDSRPWSTESPSCTESVRLVCILNVERLRRKYGVLGDNLMMLDAGVAQSFCAYIAAALGTPLDFTVVPEKDSMVREWLHERSAYYRMGWSAAVETPGWPFVRARRALAIPTLDRCLRARRSQRRLGDVGLGLPELERLLNRSAPVPHTDAEAGVLRLMRPVLALRMGECVGTYELELVRGVWTLHAVHDLHASLHERNNLVVQEALSEAGALLVFLTPLPDLLLLFGEEAHDVALRCAGRWVGELWLRLTERGLGGCPAGATVECDVLAALPGSYADLFHIFTFCFGSIR